MYGGREGRGAWGLVFGVWGFVVCGLWFVVWRERERDRDVRTPLFSSITPLPPP